ncbi:MAG: hypothetical protein BWY11_00639 [Firmicutes bacterium ADurb.Bin182]|nr:MAG: hypothetical protein BWY11_00639 [Firmicutes bacterium ADurb.Bin182]
MCNDAEDFVKMPKPDFYGNAGLNVPLEHEIRYLEYKEKLRERTKGLCNGGASGT